MTQGHPTALSEALLRHRMEHGITQAALAEALGIAQTMVSVFERGAGLPAFGTLQRLAIVLGWTPHELGTFILTTPVEAIPPRRAPRRVR